MADDKDLKKLEQKVEKSNLPQTSKDAFKTLIEENREMQRETDRAKDGKK